MELPKETSFSPLISSLNLPSVSTPPAPTAHLAAEKARQLFGCYRKGDANDPEVYVGAITLLLSTYPEDIINSVTHPVHGLPSRLKWMPSVAEVREACEEIMGPRRERAAYAAGVVQQLRERREWDAKNQ
jgi:hypothetical protein